MLSDCSSYWKILPQAVMLPRSAAIQASDSKIKRPGASVSYTLHRTESLKFTTDFYFLLVSFISFFFSCLQVFFPPFILHSHPGNRLGVYALTNWFRAIGKSLPISHEICLLSFWCALFNFRKWSGYSYKWSGYSYIAMCTHIWCTDKNIKYIPFLFFTT